jgi:Ni/Fe-hydrogenase subunit HybB-like protein
MGKIVFWLVVIFGALFVLRIVNASRARRRAENVRTPAPAGVPMVQCRECGVFLPRGEALPAADGFRCADGVCGKRR